jgi:hypothetical protein
MLATGVGQLVQPVGGLRCLNDVVGCLKVYTGSLHVRLSFLEVRATALSDNWQSLTKANNGWLKDGKISLKTSTGCVKASS